MDVFPSSSHHVLIISTGLTGQDRTLYMRLGPRNERDRDVAGGMREKQRSAIQNTTVDCYKMRSNNSGISESPINHLSKHQVFNL